jgi:outer membrane murein-binding lipoprotein Lpp
MKKILIVLLSVVLLSGCFVIDKIKELGSDISTSYDKAVTKTKETINEIKETKEKIEETVDDIKTAQEKIGEAADALSEIGK